MTTLADIQRKVGVTPDGVWGPNTADAIGHALGIMPHKRNLASPPAFFAAVRDIAGSLDQVQVDTLNALIDGAGGWPTAWLAYGLATAWHEARLRPIEEIGKGKGRTYGVPGHNGGQVPYGRGLVQLTWDGNYEKADAKLGLGGKLIANYALALDPKIAARVLIDGMAEGWFTGKGLGDYLPDERGTVPQFAAARRIINGVDKADLIAGYAQRFQAALTAGGWA